MSAELRSSRGFEVALPVWLDRNWTHVTEHEPELYTNLAKLDTFRRLYRIATVGGS